MVHCVVNCLIYDMLTRWLWPWRWPFTLCSRCSIPLSIKRNDHSFISYGAFCVWPRLLMLKGLPLHNLMWCCYGRTHTNSNNLTLTFDLLQLNCSHLLRSTCVLRNVIKSEVRTHGFSFAKYATLSVLAWSDPGAAHATVYEGSKRDRQLWKLAIYELPPHDKHATPLALTKMASLCTLRCLLAPTDKLKAV